MRSLLLSVAILFVAAGCSKDADVESAATPPNEAKT
jgi:hypothetical protein